METLSDEKWITVGKSKNSLSSSAPQNGGKYVLKIPRSEVTPAKSSLYPKTEKSPPYKNRKKQFGSAPDFNSPEEEAKFKALQIEIPHLMMPGVVRNLQRSINIDGLADKFL